MTLLATLQFFLFTVGFLCLNADVCTARSYHREKFHHFVKKHNKNYGPDEFEHRLGIYKKNKERIYSLRAKERGTATYGENEFSDLSDEEFRSQRQGYKFADFPEDIGLKQAEIPDIQIPTEFDWRKKGAVTPVKDQGICSSCWTFSTTGNVEGLHAIKTGKLISLSEQPKGSNFTQTIAVMRMEFVRPVTVMAACVHWLLKSADFKRVRCGDAFRTLRGAECELIDCARNNDGCNGGAPARAYLAVRNLGGLELERAYPYQGEDERCRFHRSRVKAQVKSGVYISTDEGDMAKWLVKHGPISIVLNCVSMRHYNGGIAHPSKEACDPNGVDHAVLIVGYGVHKSKSIGKEIPYWIIKNSWGSDWGEKGYYLVHRGDGTCGLNTNPVSAVL